MGIGVKVAASTNDGHGSHTDCDTEDVCKKGVYLTRINHCKHYIHKAIVLKYYSVKIPGSSFVHIILDNCMIEIIYIAFSFWIYTRFKLQEAIWLIVWHFTKHGF